LAIHISGRAATVRDLARVLQQPMTIWERYPARLAQELCKRQGPDRVYRCHAAARMATEAGAAAGAVSSLERGHGSRKGNARGACRTLAGSASSLRPARACCQPGWPPRQSTGTGSRGDRGEGLEERPLRGLGGEGSRSEPPFAEMPLCRYLVLPGGRIRTPSAP